MNEQIVRHGNDMSKQVISLHGHPANTLHWKKGSMNYSNLIATVVAACLLVTPVFSKPKPEDCGCGDVGFTPSKDRIKITHSKEVSDQLQAARKATPEEYARLKKVITNADTLIQRHMNGDAYADPDPEAWEAYNGALIAMPLAQWKQQAGKPDYDPNEKENWTYKERSYSDWQLCPKSTLVSVTLSPNTALARYESTIVGRGIRRWNKDDQFTFQENGRPFYLDVTLNAQAKVSQITLTPNAEGARPYSIMAGWFKNRTTEWGNAYGTPAQNTARQNDAKQNLAALLQASKICNTPAIRGKGK